MIRVMACAVHPPQILLQRPNRSPSQSIGSTCCRAHDKAPDYPSTDRSSSSRRVALSLLAAGLTLDPSDAKSNVIEDYVERSQRPEMTAEQAVVKLLDAQGVLYELKSLAATAPGSNERFRARALLPGMANRLRQVGQAAPVLVAQVTGADKRAAVSKEYGGKGDDGAIAVPVYHAIGQVITISGRTIRKEAQATPELAEHAIQMIGRLLDMLPPEELERAQRLRKARQSSVKIESRRVPMNAVA